MSILEQQTVSNVVTMLGVGLHTGEPCSITLSPAAPGYGIVFVTDRGEIPARTTNLGDTRRGTTLKCGDAEVHTVEHLLAACWGLRVDNVRIELSGPEIPAGDGSALKFVELIESAGITPQGVPAVLRKLSESVWASAGDKYLLASPSDDFVVRGLIGFTQRMIGEQANGFIIEPETFKREIAPARTFCTSDEIEMLLSQGLGRGGSEDNVIVVYADRYSVPLRFPDEFVRHKILDVIGDLSLIGGRLLADVVAVKSSHTLDAVLSQRIACGD